MAGTLKHRSRGLAGAVLAVLLAGCSQITPVSIPTPNRANEQQRSSEAAAAPTAQPAVARSAPTQSAAARPTTLPAPSPAFTQTAPVRRGPIGESVQLNGRVTGVDETPLSFSDRTTLAKVSVKVGDAVSAGQILVEAESTQLQRTLKDAVTNLDSARIQLDDARRVAADRERASTTAQQDSVATAAETLRKAQSDFAKLQAGATDIEKQSADLALRVAQTALRKAQSDQDKLTQGATPSEILTAQQQVDAAELMLRQAQADAAKVTGGADPGEMRTAERQLADAQQAQMSAKAELDRLMHAPDPFDVRAAQREVDRAQAALDAANALPSGTPAQANREATITAAKLHLQDAQDGLTKAKQPPKPDVLAAAGTRVDDTSAAVATAQEKLDALRKGPSQLAIDKANASVESARITRDQARSKLDALRAGPSRDELQAAAGAIEAAQLNLDVAQSKRDEVVNRPSPAELTDGKARIDAAQRMLDRARLLSAGDDTSQANAERGLQKMQEQVAQLQSDLDATRLRAPFDGRVVALQASQGMSLERDIPAVIVARSSDPFIAVTLPAPPTTDGSAGTSAPGGVDRPAVSRVATGQKALIQIDGADGTPLGGVVSAVLDGATPSAGSGVVDGPTVGARTAQIQADWGSMRPNFGATALVQITVQQKQDVLLVPTAAVHSASGRKYVEILDGSSRRLQPIQTGITSGTVVEVLDGLDEGQLVVGGSNAASSSATNLSPSVPAAAPPATGDALVGPLLDEDFANNDRQWRSDQQSTAWVDDRGYHLLARQANQFVAIAAPLPVAQVPRDVMVTARFQKIGGPAGGGYGIILRDQDPGARDGKQQNGAFYVLEVGDKGEFGIWQRDGDRWVDILPWTKSDAVQPGRAENELTVTALGDQLSFQINSIDVATVRDSTLTAGGVGVFVGGDVNEVRLTHFTVERP